jgi:hypothetical protein
MITSVFKNLRNIPGWSTNRKIVIIESDDWGSIRMPSREVYKKLLTEGLGLNSGDGKRYSMYDSIETSADLQFLFQTLHSFKDIHDSSAVFTVVAVVANPDFEKIRENGFQKYVYEPFPETCKKYNGCGNTFQLYKEGIENRIFVPQFHGREHLNVPVWMKALQTKNTETHLAFNEGMWAFVPKQNLWEGLEYEAAFQLSDISELETHKEILKEGLALFEILFGYRADYFVPPNGHINNELNTTCFEEGIKFRSSAKIQIEPAGNGIIKKKIHWLGQMEKSGIRYITRNCFFEPSSGGKDWVDSCLNDIKIAFRWHKPAIISSHRVNYIGAHDATNRNNGLKQLNMLLSSVKKNWPEVEFMSTSQLGSLMNHKSY